MNFRQRRSQVRKTFSFKATGYGQTDGDSLIASPSTNRIWRGEHKVSGRDKHWRDGIGSEVNNHASKAAGGNCQQVAFEPARASC